jgi:hypothetical protein
MLWTDKALLFVLNNVILVAVVLDFVGFVLDRSEIVLNIMQINL